MLNYFLCTTNTFLYKVDFLSCFYDLLLYFLHQGPFKRIFRYSGIKKNLLTDVLDQSASLGLALVSTFRPSSGIWSIGAANLLPTAILPHDQRMSTPTWCPPGSAWVCFWFRPTGVEDKGGDVSGQNKHSSSAKGTVHLRRWGAVIWLVCCHGYFTNSLIDLYN